MASTAEPAPPPEALEPDLRELEDKLVAAAVELLEEGVSGVGGDDPLAAQAQAILAGAQAKKVATAASVYNIVAGSRLRRRLANPAPKVEEKRRELAKGLGTR
jgi:hypothetical protein